MSEQKKAPKPLTLKQTAFVNAYLRCFNATKAAIAAGYSEKSANALGSQLVSNPKVNAAIRARMEKDAMDTSEVLFHLAQIARGDYDDFVDEHGNVDLKKAREMGKTNLIKKIRSRTMTTTDKDGEGSDIFETETEPYDRVKALELIGKYLKIWTEKVQIDDWRSQALSQLANHEITPAALVATFGSVEAVREAFGDRARDLPAELFAQVTSEVSVSEDS